MLRDIWISFRNLPAWVQIWMSVVLVPANLVPLAFLDQPYGTLIAGLAILGMALNLPIMMAERGMSRAMALPHLLFWTPMVLIIVYVLNTHTDLLPIYAQFLLVLLVVDLISLGFDLRDAILWNKNRKRQ
ncbi:hypothetical protein ABLN87_02575 [Ruegeria sp. SCPT10]|uniref:hypothetical protein n=1 Tax=Ruegeria sp. SCP10 TaxID=3141377 RepID=UPI00333C3230